MFRHCPRWVLLVVGLLANTPALALEGWVTSFTPQGDMVVDMGTKDGITPGAPFELLLGKEVVGSFVAVQVDERETRGRFLLNPGFDGQASKTMWVRPGGVIPPQLAPAAPAAPTAPPTPSAATGAVPSPATTTTPAAASNPMATVVIPAGTKITLNLDQELSSQSSTTGQEFFLSAAYPVAVGGAVVIAQGAKARGLVTNAKPAKGFGRSGNLEFVVTQVEAIDGTPVPLSYAQDNNRKNQFGKAAVGIYMTGMLGGGAVKGKKIHLATGTAVELEIPQDTRLGRPGAASPTPPNGASSPTPVGQLPPATSGNGALLPVVGNAGSLTASQVASICQRVIDRFQGGRPVSEVLVDEGAKEANASADSGARITFTGLMVRSFYNESELAMVCGHEAAHIAMKHYVRKKKKGLLSIALDIGGRAAGLGGLGGEIGERMFSKDSRSAEREADELGLQAMWSAGFNPLLGVAFWERDIKEHGSGGGSLWSTHPANTERLDNMKKIMVRLCQQTPDTIYCGDILNLPAMIPHVERARNGQ